MDISRKKDKFLYPLAILTVQQKNVFEYFYHPGRKKHSSAPFMKMFLLQGTCLEDMNKLLFICILAAMLFEN
jgi:hypothetical protein